MLAVLLAAALASGPPHAELTYEVHRVVQGTGGAYRGWSEQLSSQGTYRVSPEGPDVAVEADYTWRYGDSEGKRDQGHEQRTVTFAPDTRLYAGRTDLDEYDDVAGPLATWLWIPPDVTAHQRLKILDHTYVIEALDDRWSATAEPAILAKASGTAQRDDVYGRFDYTWTDRFWFDRETGMVLAERYEEQDRGTYEGERAEFRWTEWLDVTSASYVDGRSAAPLPPGFQAWDAPAPDADASAGSDVATQVGRVLGLLVVGVLGTVVSGVAIAYVRSVGLSGGVPSATITGRLGDEAARSPAHGPFRVRTLARDAPVEALAADQRATKAYAPWLTDLVARTRLGLGEVAVAVEAGGQGACVGLALKDGQGGLGTIFTKCPVVAESLRRQLDLRTFFANAVHELDGKPAYNRHERFLLLVRDVPGRRTWDRDLVRPLEPRDVEAVVALLSEAFEEPCRPYVETSLAAGDVALVAEREGRVVGVGFASVAGRHGRLHGVAVAPAHRNAGLGSELVAARLSALGDLGVTSVLVEVAADHAASLHLARKHGFQPVGELHVLTLDEAPVRRAWHRT